MLLLSLHIFSTSKPQEKTQFNNPMGNSLPLPGSSLNLVSKPKAVLPIQKTFKLPSPIPPWPPGTGFASGSVNLKGLEVIQISTFSKIWTTHEGGLDNLGATFFKPSPIPLGYFMLGCYCQPNNKPLSGWVLAGKGKNGALEKPVDFSLVWTTESLNIKQDGHGYFWLPTPPDNYKAVGIMVTDSPEKPSPNDIRCVRSDLTDECQVDTWIWGMDKAGNHAINIYGLRPTTRGTHAVGVCVGTFIAQVDGVNPSLACLKNSNLDNNFYYYMPSLSQIQALMKAYSPLIYFHPDEAYLPSSVSWFFNNGALLHTNTGPVGIPIDLTGSNLPQGGSNDGSYWLDLPADRAAAEKVKKGDLQSSEAYIHVKPMLGATFTDIAIWVFYPFNGPARAKVEFVNISLGKIGEHVGDWEHVTLRISNFNGELWRVYFSEHSGGKWIDASELEFQDGNKVVAYSSLHGHASYSKEGLDLQGNSKAGIGIRNDSGKGKYSMDSGARFVVISAEHLDSIQEPPWLNYAREWGPKVSYDIDSELKKLERLLPGKLKQAFEKVIRSLPKEVLGEEGPTGPKMKNNWSGDEV